MIIVQTMYTLMEASTANIIVASLANVAMEEVKLDV